MAGGDHRHPGGEAAHHLSQPALLVGGQLSIFSEPGDGTTIELTMGAT